MAGEIIEGIKPTRMELLKLKKRTILAKKGHKLLREKRDALISEFMKVISTVRDSRSEMEESLSLAFRDLYIAQALMGSESLAQVSLITDQDIDLKFEFQNIMGVKVPAIETGDILRKVSERGYGLLGTTSKLDEAARNFEQALLKVIKAAEVEERVRRLAEEVEKTKRRVNALEYVVIPRLNATVRYIQMKLEEMARDAFLRLKKIKKALEAKD